MKSKVMQVAVIAGGAAAMVAVGGSAAVAGEITGNGEYLDMKAKSICAFSGQNDGFHDPDAQHDATGTARVQSFGQYVKSFGPMGGVPGTACNPTAGGGE